MRKIWILLPFLVTMTLCAKSETPPSKTPPKTEKPKTKKQSKSIEDSIDPKTLTIKEALKATEELKEMTFKDPKKKVTLELFTGLLEDALNQSIDALEMSNNLKKASKNIENIRTINNSYLLSMIKLSYYVGNMVDKIAKMTDKISESKVIVDAKISEKMLKTVVTIIANNQKTLVNLLQAETKFNALIKTIY